MSGAVLCAVDDSRQSTEVVRVGAELAERLGLRLMLAHAVPVAVTPGVATAAYAYAGVTDGDALDAAEATLDNVAAMAAVKDGTELRPLVGPPAERLLDLAESETPELIVVGASGRRRIAAALLGSVATTLAATAPCPVVVVPSRRGAGSTHETMSAAKSSAGIPDTIICGVDDSGGAREAATVTGALAERLRARLVLVTVTPPPDDASEAAEDSRELASKQRRDAELLLAEVAVDLHLGARVERLVALGEPVDRLAAIAEAEGAHLIVTGSRGRGPLRSALLGSVSTALGARAPCPVVIVPSRPPSVRREDE